MQFISTILNKKFKLTTSTRGKVHIDGRRKKGWEGIFSSKKGVWVYRGYKIKWGIRYPSQLYELVLVKLGGVFLTLAWNKQICLFGDRSGPFSSHIFLIWLEGTRLWVWIVFEFSNYLRVCFFPCCSQKKFCSVKSCQTAMLKLDIPCIVFTNYLHY